MKVNKRLLEREKNEIEEEESKGPPYLHAVEDEAGRAEEVFRLGIFFNVISYFNYNNIYYYNIKYYNYLLIVITNLK